MPLENSQAYTHRHAHPMDPNIVEIVAYERGEGGWDVFVFTPDGITYPEIEETRRDSNHIFIKTISHVGELDKVAREIADNLGEGYQIVPYFQEQGTRKTIQRIVDCLKNNGADGMIVHSLRDNIWVLSIRKRHREIAETVTRPNV